VKLHAETTGRGPPLLLLHGWGLHSGVWTALLPQLRQRFRLTCVDLPGHGHSAPVAPGDGLQEWAQAVAAVAPRSAAWLGWSLGAQVVLAAALAGEDIRRLVLVAATPRFVAAPDWPCGMDAATLAGFGESLALDHRRTIRDFLTLQLRGDRHAGALLGTLRAALAQRGEPDSESLSSGLRILADTDLRDRLARLQQPALVVTGERDRLVPAEAGRRLATGLPDGRYLELAGAAHAPFLTHPAAFAGAVTTFLLDEQAIA